MERRDRSAAVYFCVALAASVGLALAIAYLEVRRTQEAVQLEERWLRELQRLEVEVERLKEELGNRTARITERITTLEADTPVAGPAADDDYYYDEYEDEDGGDEEGKEGGGKRTRREVGRGINPALAPYNLILRQGFKTSPNRTGPVEVKAKIEILGTERSQAGYGVKPSYGKPQVAPESGSSVAVHYTGNTSTARNHPRGTHCYDANHRMCHVQGIFRDWSPAHWSGDLQSTFSLQDGHLTLRRAPGLYYLYAQIFYADNHDTNGYRIYVNSQPTFQCTVTGLHDHRWIPARVPYKKNSCYTGGLVRLGEGDHITIREIDDVERYSVFEPYKSYFGLFRVAPEGNTR